MKIVLDINIQMDQMIEHRRPDITTIDKSKQTALLIDVAVPGNARMDEKEQETIDKYQDLAMELRSWKMKTKVIPIVVGAVGTVRKGLEKNLKKAGTTISVDLLQKIALIGTAHILRRVLESL